MYNATQDLILTVKKKMISIVPQCKSNFIWPDTRGIKVHYLLPVHGHGSDFRDSIFTNSTKKNNKSINFYSFKILFPLWLASLVQLAECRPGKREAMSSPAGRARTSNQAFLKNF